jgi:putative nucleotidyltransferase with HDIG domain
MDQFYLPWIKIYREFLEPVQDLAAQRRAKLYLVGGALRDIILGRDKDNPDFDFCLKSKAIDFARRLAAKMKAGFVVLDSVHGCARVVKKSRGKLITLDFSDFRGRTLELDLFYRDFTINSMAVSLEDILSQKSFEETLIDLYGGRKDLTKGLIRQVYSKSFDDDPLRIMRAFSLSAIFGFKIDPVTFRQISLKRKKLGTVSSERIRDELFKIFSSPKGFEIIEGLDNYKILELIFPEIKSMKVNKKNTFGRLNVWGHTLLTFKNIELLIIKFGRDSQIGDYLNQEISSGRSRAQLLKLAAILHDVGKPRTFRVEKGKVQFHGHERVGSALTGAIAVRLKLSNEELRLLKRIVFMHLRPGYLVTNPLLTAKAKFRFFRDAGEEAGAVLILALADERSTKGYLLLDKSRKNYEKLIPRLLKEYFNKQKNIPQPRLVDGDDIMKRLKLPPSPLIGRVLRELEELQAIKKIKTKEQALKAAKEIIKNT